MKPKSYKDLEVYKLAHKLAVEVHRMSLEDLPKFEMYEQGSQIRRSSKAIVATLVEGFGRKQYQQEYIRYLTFALASCDETKEHLQLLFDTGSLKNKELFDQLTAQYEDLGRKIYRFRQVVETDLTSRD